MNQMREFLVGAMDLHVHCNPDVLPREVDDFTLAKRIVDCGMLGYGIKSHFFCTAQRAESVRRLYPKCYAAGAITLNRAVGGINPIAVELAGRAGAKLVWFPSCDAENEKDNITRESKVSPPWVKIVRETRAAGIAYDPIYILNEDGRLIPEAYDVLTLIKKYDMVLATSHLTHRETFALVKGAADKGIEKIVITHASAPSTFYTIEEQKELTSYGAYIEHCFTTYSKGLQPFGLISEQIRAIGADRVILGTDLGPKGYMTSDEGMLQFMTDLYQDGFTEDEVRKMGGRNNYQLVAD